MCGFIGAWDLEGRPSRPRVRPWQLRALAHRGPDAEAMVEGDRYSLGFRRLAIIDRAGGMQPLVSADGGVQLVVNGEVYNHQALRAELEGDHRFQSQVDAEVVLHGYAAWGEAVFGRIRGMFALGLVDLHRQQLVLARDRVGKKPLYYTVREGVVWFASELRPLLGDRVPPVDHEALNDYLRFGYVPAPRTLFSGVSRLPAGCLLVADRRGHVQVRRWSPLLARDPETRGTADDWAVQVREALYEATAIRLESEVPLGFLLSGGVDSAGVFAAGARACSGTARAFTIGFQESELDETAAAAEVARQYGADHVVRVLARNEAPDLAAVVARSEEPIATDALLPTDRVFAAVRAAGITTVLGGDGSDELFAGYSKFVAATGTAEDWRASGSTPLERYLSREEFCFPGLDERRRLIGEAATDQGYGWLEEAVDGLRPLSQMLAIEVALRLPDRINHRLDRLSMAYAIEARAPYMDRPLMELAFQVPHPFRVRAGVGKAILRRALREELPERVLAAQKAPFRAPNAWFTSGAARLGAGTAAEAGLVDPAEVVALGRRAEREPAARERLYNLTVLHLWFRRWYGGPAFAPAPR